VVFSAQTFTNLTHFTDFSVVTPTVKQGDAWAGKGIGVSIVATGTDASGSTSGVWDLDNVRLKENEAPVLSVSGISANGDVTLGISGEAGAVFDVLAASALDAQWPVVGAVTNTAGYATWTDTRRAPGPQFYRLRQQL
jgi:hypothetical protein